MDLSKQKAAMQVLVVDDHADYRIFVSYILTRAGFSVLTAAGGEEALSIATSQEVHFVITDVVMTNGDGRSFLEQLTCQKPEIPVAIMTCSDMTLTEALDYGALTLLRKPIASNILIDMLHSRCQSQTSV